METMRLLFKSLGRRCSGECYSAETLARSPQNLSTRDRKRKKFVGSNGQDEPRKKRIKTESGHWIQASYKSSAYKEWKEKHKVNAHFGGQEEEEEEGGGASAQRFGPSRGPRRFRHKQNAREQAGKEKKRGMVADLKPKSVILKKRQKKELLERRKRMKNNQKMMKGNSNSKSNRNTNKFRSKGRK